MTPKQASYDVGEQIVVDFSDGPGNATDWVGFYQPGNIPDGEPGSITWLYTNGTGTGGGALTEGTLTFPAGSLAAGDYALWFLANDGYQALAGPVTLTITKESAALAWVTPEFRRRHAVAGTAYTGKISAYTSDPGFTFGRVSGPEWLTVSASGELGGTPTEDDAGFNTFVVNAGDGTDKKEATMKIEVCLKDAEVVRELKVMSYNAWHGWGQMNDGHRKGLESIILSDADLIGMQESTDNVSGSGIYQPQKIAADLGWHYRTGTSGSVGIISRYPIADATLAAGVARGARITVTESPKREVILMNCHLDYQRYGPYAAQLAGATAASVMAEERASQRDEQIAGLMTAMTPLLANADKIPVFLTGDFNAPSHLDWTPETAVNHGGVGNVAWPASTRVLGDGMKDSFREVHPDPAALAGETWSPIFKGGEAQDRIDFVYFMGNAATPVASEVFTTAVEEMVGTWGGSTDVTKNNTWPSDHASVVSTFKLTCVDADADELCDAYEMRYFKGLTSQNGSGDADGDGASNADEELFATNPKDALSKPQFRLAEVADRALEFSFSEAAFAKDLVCEKSSDLQSWEAIWSYQSDPLLTSEVLSTNEISPGAWTAEIRDREDARPRQTFYRLLGAF